MMTIKGKVIYQSLGPGFWGIEGQDGQNWRPLEMPGALQKEGLEVEVQAEKVDNAMSVFMWGTAIQIKKVVKP